MEFMLWGSWGKEGHRERCLLDFWEFFWIFFIFPDLKKNIVVGTIPALNQDSENYPY